MSDMRRAELLRRGLWQCYVAAGADTNGDDRFHGSDEMAIHATLLAVTDLMNDYEDAARQASART